MMNETKMTLINQLKEEFASRYGVEITVGISIHAHRNPNITKDLANMIVNDYTHDKKGIRNHKDQEDLMVGWYNNGLSYKEPFELSVFYPLGAEDID